MYGSIEVNTSSLQIAVTELDTLKTYYQTKSRTFTGAYGGPAELSKLVNKINTNYTRISTNLGNTSNYLKDYISDVEGLEKKFAQNGGTIKASNASFYASQYCNSIKLFHLSSVPLFKINRVNSNSSVTKNIIAAGLSIEKPKPKYQKPTNDLTFGSTFTIGNKTKILASAYNLEEQYEIKEEFKDSEYTIVSINMRMPDGSLKIIRDKDPSANQIVARCLKQGGVIETIGAVAALGKKDYEKNGIITGYFNMSDIHPNSEDSNSTTNKRQEENLEDKIKNQNNISASLDQLNNILFGIIKNSIKGRTDHLHIREHLPIQNENYTEVFKEYNKQLNMQETVYQEYQVELNKELAKYKGLEDTLSAYEYILRTNPVEATKMKESALKEIRKDFDSLEDFETYMSSLRQELALCQNGLAEVSNLRVLGKYDCLIADDDFQNFKYETKEITIPETDLNNYKYHSVKVPDYEEFCQKYGEVSKLEYAKLVGEYSNDKEIQKLYKLTKASEINPNIEKTYLYLLETQNPNYAETYLEDMESSINNILGSMKADEFLNELKTSKNVESALLNHVSATGEGLKAGLNSFGTGIKHSISALESIITGNEGTRINSIEEYKQMYILQGLQSGEYTGAFLSNNYEISQGIGNMAPSIILSSINPVAGSVALGTSSAGNSYHSALVDGYSNMQALLYAGISGSSEVLTEKLFGGLPGLSDVKVNSLKTFAQSIMKEGNEEALQEVMDAGFRKLIFNEDIDIEELIENTKKSYVYGAITAGILQGPSAIKTSVEINRVNHAIQTGKINDGQIRSVLNEIQIDTSNQEIKNVIRENSAILSKYIQNPTILSDIKKQIKPRVKDVSDSIKEKEVITIENIDNVTLDMLNEISHPENMAFNVDGIEYSVSDIERILMKKSDGKEFNIENSKEVFEKGQTDEEIRKKNYNDFKNIENKTLKTKILENFIVNYINKNLSQNNNLNMKINEVINRIKQNFQNGPLKEIISETDLKNETIGEITDVAMENINNQINDMAIKGIKSIPFILNCLPSSIFKMFNTPLENHLEIKNKVLNEGLYHITTPENANKILTSNYIKKGGIISSYGSKKSFFFAGNPTLQNVALNIGNVNQTQVAIKLKIDEGQIKDFNYRNIDQAISYNGDYHFDNGNAEIVYLGLKEENGILKYQEISKEQYNNYQTKISPKKADHIINTFKAFSIGLNEDLTNTFNLLKIIQNKGINTINQLKSFILSFKNSQVKNHSIELTIENFINSFKNALSIDNLFNNSLSLENLKDVDLQELLIIPNNEKIFFENNDITYSKEQLTNILQDNKTFESVITDLNDQITNGRIENSIITLDSLNGITIDMLNLIEHPEHIRFEVDGKIFTQSDLIKVLNGTDLKNYPVQNHEIIELQNQIEQMNNQELNSPGILKIEDKGILHKELLNMIKNKDQVIFDINGIEYTVPQLENIVNQQNINKTPTILRIEEKPHHIENYLNNLKNETTIDNLFKKIFPIDNLNEIELDALNSITNEETIKFKYKDQELTIEEIKNLKNLDRVESFNLLPENAKNYIIKNIDNIDFAAAKTLSEIFSKGMQTKDQATIKIVENINVLDNFLKIKMYDNFESDSATYVNENSFLNNGNFVIRNEIGASREAITHELGHAIFDLVDNKTLPDNFYKIMDDIKQKWQNDSTTIESFLQEARDYKEGIWSNCVREAEQYIEINKEIINKQIDELLKDPDMLKEELIEYQDYTPGALTIEAIYDLVEKNDITEIREIMQSTYKNFHRYHQFISESSNNESMKIYDTIAGLIDSIYDGENPYFKTIYDSGFLRLHAAAYFEKVKIRSFDEQFADFTSIKMADSKVTYQIASELFGSDWINMMETKYQSIADKMETLKNTQTIKDSIKLLNEETFKISDNLYEEIKFMLTDSIAHRENISLLEKIKNNQVTRENFYEIFKDQKSNLERLIKRRTPKNYLLEDYVNIQNDLVQKYQGLDLDSIKKSNLEEKITELDEFFKISYEIEKNYNDMSNYQDLKYIEPLLQENLKYLPFDYCEDFQTKWKESMNKKDINASKDLIEQINAVMLSEWKKFPNNLEQLKNNENFAFIGHSVPSPSFTGEFNGKYVSSSLFTENLTDTFHSGYGFIMNPEKVIIAGSKDLYINNNANNLNKAQIFNSIPLIEHPLKIIENCLKNKKESPNSKIYNEVVIEGFNPIGIFCFTDGSKELNKNYQNALKLKEQFPTLEIIEKDTMSNATGPDLEKLQLSLINELSEKKYTLEDLPLFENFFKDFATLKKDQNYTVEDIRNCFNKNLELIEKKSKTIIKLKNLQDISLEQLNAVINPEKYVFEYQNEQLSFEEYKERLLNITTETPVIKTKFEQELENALHLLSEGEESVILKVENIKEVKIEDLNAIPNPEKIIFEYFGNHLTFDEIKERVLDQTLELLDVPNAFELAIEQAEKQIEEGYLDVLVNIENIRDVNNEILSKIKDPDRITFIYGKYIFDISELKEYMLELTFDNLGNLVERQAPPILKNPGIPKEQTNFMNKIRSILNSDKGPKEIKTIQEAAMFFNDSKQYLYGKFQKLADQDKIWEKYLIKFTKNKGNGTYNEEQLYKFLNKYGQISVEEQELLKQLKENEIKLTQKEKDVIYLFTKNIGPYLSAYNRETTIFFGKAEIDGLDIDKLNKDIQYVLKKNPKATLDSDFDIKDLNATMDSIIQKSGGVKENIKVYRGVNGLFVDGMELQLKDLKKGTIINDSAHLSTGLKTAGIAARSTYILEIEVPKGTKAAYIETFAGIGHYNQQELLLPRNTKLEITDKPIYDRKTGKVILKAKVIDTFNQPNMYTKMSELFHAEGIDAKDLFNQFNESDLLKQYNDEVSSMYLEGLYDGLDGLKSGEHDYKHVENVLLYSMYMANKLNLSKNELDILITCAKYHDTGVRNGHKNHSILSAEILKEKLEGSINEKTLSLMQAIIAYHEQPDTNLEKICQFYGLQKNDIEQVSKIGNILKDADAIDRVRFPGNLNPNFFRNSISNDLIKSAYQIREQQAASNLEIKLRNQEFTEIEMQDIYNLINQEYPAYIIEFAQKYYQTNFAKNINSLAEFAKYIYNNKIFRVR